ncbi:ATP-binding protein [Cellulosimicrobium marinum]|uniref:ATP-binding protein n=1 Tax=Cellulosimicrobium marinum TaxID=1638992 RepID=UPI001E41F3A6|nr:ATP-binding protein [Cellulosimicrobium marinum]MCB7135932.1 ATP-binding protein [Cellulosimicrobium marinum]
MSDAVLAALAAAVQVSPDSAPLRVHYASLLLDAGRTIEAIDQASAALRLDPASAEAVGLLQRAAAAAGTTTAPASVPPVAPAGGDPADRADDAPSGIDWTRLESELDVDVPPPFVTPTTEQPTTQPTEPSVLPPGPPRPVPVRDDGPDDGEGLLEVSRETVTLADVGGLEPVKQRIREAFLEPMRHQAVARAFGKSLRGGLLLYGPPGTGKTYMARAVAGELGARFLTVTLADILDKYIGESEQNLHALFQKARRLAPAVLFLDEVDAIGGKRAQYSGSSGMRTVVNQLLQEMDGIGSDNDGLFVLGATNHPWDVDTALLRPGRFDRVVLVLPPDEPAREAILRHHLSGRPVAGIDLRSVVGRTDGFSGADLEHLAATAAEKAMMDSIATGQVRPITMADLDSALADVRPSTTAWLQSARNVVTFANDDGRYDDLAAYLRARRML